MVTADSNVNFCEASILSTNSIIKDLGGIMYRIKRQENIEDNYKLMVYMVKRVLEDEKDIIACLSNISAVINGYMSGINWVGFYLTKGSELVLGPFQGLPACVRISFGKGVCGTAALTKKTQVVDDVEKFPGHIACDSASKSEVVIPIIVNGEVFGVLDVDAPVLNRFGELEVRHLAEIVSFISSHIELGEN